VNGRVGRLVEALSEPLLVTTLVNVRYLTGFDSSNAAALVEPDRVRLFSDFRYATAGRQVPDVEFVETERSLIADLAERLSGRIAFEADQLSYAAWETLSAGGLELVPTHGVVEALRAVKDERELTAIREAAAITNEVYERISQGRFSGRTERDVAWEIGRLFHERGAERPSFDTVVAAGPNGALPHATPSERKIERGQTIVVDAGCVVDGYCSDCTRTFAAGPLSDELKEVYEVCARAQEQALAAVAAGRSCREVDAVARDSIADAGFGEGFGHGLGHGVGLLVHEAPRLTHLSEEVLAAGNVVTIEPGIYLEGSGGVRIEDLVVVGSEGPEVLTSFTKALVTVD
jgi:Xaa-Pro aminopeptidase